MLDSLGKYPYNVNLKKKEMINISNKKMSCLLGVLTILKNSKGVFHLRRILLLFLVLLCTMTLIGCGNGAGRTIEAAIRNKKLTISDKIVKLEKVIYQEEIKDGILAIYTTEQQLLLGVSYLSKTTTGWKFETGTFLNFSQHFDINWEGEVTWQLSSFPRTKNSDEDDYLALYTGVIKNPDITEVRVRTTNDSASGEQYDYKVEILTNKRMWFVVIPPDATFTMVNRPSIVEIVGLSENGNMLYRFP